MEQKQIDEITNYIAKFQPGCEKYLSPLCDPKDKKVLVIGSGWGTEIAWLLSKGAKEIVGIDPAPRSQIPLDIYVEKNKLKGDYQIIKGQIEDLVKEKEKYFDLVVSHNVFEHIMDLTKVFNNIPKILSENGKVAIFTDPLYYSSVGAHLNIEPWEHLWGDLDAIKERVSNYQWHEFSNGLNKMTVSSFLKEVIDSGAIITQFFLKPDRNLDKFHLYQDKLKNIPPADLTIEGISIELYYSS